MVRPAVPRWAGGLPPPPSPPAHHPRPRSHRPCRSSTVRRALGRRAARHREARVLEDMDSLRHPPARGSPRPLLAQKASSVRPSTPRRRPAQPSPTGPIPRHRRERAPDCRHPEAPTPVGSPQSSVNDRAPARAPTPNARSCAHRRTVDEGALDHLRELRSGRRMGQNGLGGSDQAAVHAGPCDEESFVVENLEDERVAARRTSSRVRCVRLHPVSLRSRVPAAPPDPRVRRSRSLRRWPALFLTAKGLPTGDVALVRALPIPASRSGG